MQEHAKHLNEEISQLLSANEKLESENHSLKDEIGRKRVNNAHTQALLEKDGQIIDLKKLLNLKEQEVDKLMTSQDSWVSERKSLKVKADELQTNLRAKLVYNPTQL